MKWVPTEGLQGAGLQIDGQTQSYSAGADSAKQFVWQGSGTHAAKATVNLGGPDLTLTTGDGLWAAFRLFGKADHWEQHAQTGDHLEWIMRSGNGKEAATLPNGKAVTVQFELNMSGSPSIFRREFFSHMGCVAEVAKPQ